MSDLPQFQAPWGTLVKATTAFSVVLLLALPIVIYMVNPEMPGWAAIFAVGGPIGFLIVMSLYMVAGYSVEEGTLYIHRLYFRAPIALGEAPELEAQPGAMAGALRVMGNGGLFAITGYFRSHALGSFRAWVTDAERIVIIRTEGKTYLVSPENPETFIHAVRDCLKTRQPRPDSFTFLMLLPLHERT